MNRKLQLYTLLASLLTIVNSLAIDNEIVGDIKLNDPNAKYSKKISSSSSTTGKVTKGLSNVMKWIVIIIIIIVAAIIITCILCCLGCCTCCGVGSSGKKEKYDSSDTTVTTGRPYGSEPEVINVEPPHQPSPPPQAYNPVYPSYGAQPQGSYPPPSGYPPQQSPYGQPLYPNVQ